MPEIKHYSACTNCGHTEEIRKVEGVYPDHASGFVSVQISSLPVVNHLLCAGCLGFVTKSLRLARELAVTT